MLVKISKIIITVLLLIFALILAKANAEGKFKNDNEFIGNMILFVIFIATAILMWL